MKKILPIILLALGLNSSCKAADIPESIHISENRHFLVDQNGTPFFYLADTAWELFHRLGREEADLYLRNRAGKGFTVIQAVAVAELDGIKDPNAYGDLPFLNEDPSRPDVKEGPDNDYWDHVDYIVRRANELGLYIAMLPTWGRYWHDEGNVIFTPENARAYGEWLARRYRDAKIIWVLGGDRAPDTDGYKEIIRQMAEGLIAGDGHNHLITFHPRGDSGSSQYIHDEPWLDFNMRQNGHNNLAEPYKNTYEDWLREGPVKPVLDGEPIYEDHPVSFDPGRRGHSVSADCRRALYWDLFNGACGHTYGHHSIWQMWDLGKNPINNPLMPWYEALDQPGSSQMQWGKKLILSRPYLTRIPATEEVLPAVRDIPTSWPGEGMYRFAATMDVDGTYLMVYVPAGRKFLVNTAVIKADRLTGWWFNPRNGKSIRIRNIEKGERVEFVSPDPGEQLDWVLIIDDAGKGYKKP